MNLNERGGRSPSTRGRKLMMRAVGLCLSVAAPAAAQPAMQPYPVDHFARRDSAADARFLLDAPAGKAGFIQARDGHLVTPDGRRFRCWGVNISGWTRGSTLLPPKPDADVFAAELARLGVNCVRFQFLDLPNTQKTIAGDDRTEYHVPVTYTPAGLIDDRRDDTKVFDPQQIDRLDYLVARLKANGVYTDFNLNVGRRYKKGDDVPDYDLINVAKGMVYFGPELIVRQKEYARALLTHRNPYTNTRYADEPAVAIVEILNENSLLEFWMRNWLRGELTHDAGPHYQLDLTPHYKALLTAEYNAWLAKTRSPAELAALRSSAAVAPGQPVPLLRRGEFDTAPKSRFYAETAFYTQVEGDFFADMESYLKKTLGVKSLIIDTNDHTFQIPGQPLLRSTSKADIVDGHVYWQHPAIYGKRNTPMVDDPLHSITVKLTRSAMAGKPYTVSEVNEPFPNEYDSDMIPILAAYGALQDWDGIFVYSFEPKVSGQWSPYIGDHFDISEDPAKVAQLPVGAMIFLRHDVRPAEQTVLRTYSTEQIDEAIRLPQSNDPFFTPGFPPVLALEHGSRVECLDCAPTPTFKATVGDPILSDTQELAWYHDPDKGGLVTISTDRTEALVGFVKANAIETPHLSADVSNTFSAITLSSLDGKPIPRSDRLLLTTTGKVQNTGSAWNARRTMYLAWGDAPTLIEPIQGWIELKGLEGAVDVTAIPLDGSARPLGEVKGRYLEFGWEFPVGTPAATSYLIKVAR